MLHQQGGEDECATHRSLAQGQGTIACVLGSRLFPLSLDGLQRIVTLSHDSRIDHLLEDIDFRLRKVPCADMALKEQVELRKCPSFGFRDPEICVNSAKKGAPGPELQVILA